MFTHLWHRDTGGPFPMQAVLQDGVYHCKETGHVATITPTPSPFRGRRPGLAAWARALPPPGLRCPRGLHSTRCRVGLPWLGQDSTVPLPAIFCGQAHGPSGQGVTLKGRPVTGNRLSLCSRSRGGVPSSNPPLNTADSPWPQTLLHLLPSCPGYQDVVPQMDWALMDSHTGDLHHE